MRSCTLWITVFAVFLAVSNLNAQPLTRRGIAKEKLLYEGRPFDDWKSDYRTELEPKAHHHAIAALLAFAENGYSDDVVVLLGESLEWGLAAPTRVHVLRTLVTLGGWSHLQKEIARTGDDAQVEELLQLLTRRRDIPESFVTLLLQQFATTSDSSRLGTLCRIVGNSTTTDIAIFSRLLKWANSEHVSLQRRACDAIGRMPLNDAARQLIEQQFNTLPLQSRERLGYTMLFLTNDAARPESIGFAKFLLQSTEDTERLMACRALGKSGSASSEVRRIGLELIRAPDAGIANQSFELLAFYGPNTVEVRDALTQHILKSPNQSFHRALIQASQTNAELIAIQAGELIEDNRLQYALQAQYFTVLQQLGRQAKPALPAIIRVLENSVAPVSPAAPVAPASRVAAANRGGGGGFNRTAASIYSNRGIPSPLEGCLNVLNAIGPDAQAALPALKKIASTPKLPDTDRYQVAKTIKLLEGSE